MPKPATPSASGTTGGNGAGATGLSEATRRETEAEQRHVDRVHERLEVMRGHARAFEAEGHRRALFGNEGGLVERDAIVYQATQWLARLDAQEEGLVFGRLDFEDGGTTHVGRIGVRDEEYEPLVVDWRAPAAAAFYRATAADRADVVRRRTIRCAGARVLRLDDDLLAPESAQRLGLTVVGDGALMAALTRKRDTAMHDIVATIQKEQDLAVRSPADGATLITGGPGTGKTAVALHRAAYLLFNERKRFESGGVLIIGPSAVFTAYIEQVLPSLGEHSASLRSLGELVDGVRATRHDPAALAALKGSPALLPVLAAAVRSAPAGTPREFRATYQGHVMRLDGARLDAVRHAVLARYQHPNASRAQAETALVAAAWERLPAELRERRRGERAMFDRELRDRTEFEAFVEVWWPYRTAVEALRACADQSALAAAARRRLTGDQVARLAESWAAPDFSVEDVPLLDELSQLLGNPPLEPDDADDPFAGSEVSEVSSWAERSGSARRGERARQSYAHVIVDEAQDLSPLQWRVLGRLGRRASWTVVGDPVQSAWPDPRESAEAMRTAIGDKKIYSYELHTNYRNSAEIYAYAAHYARRAAPNAVLPDAVRTTGFPPESIADLGTAVSTALDAVEGTVGVITTLADRDRIAGELAALTAAHQGRLIVVHALDAKGLEYDGAVVVDPRAIEHEGGSAGTGTGAGTRTLYVALTRATQRLFIVS